MIKLDSEAFRKDLARAISKLPGRVQLALKHTAQYAALMARTSKLYKKHTHELEKSIGIKVIAADHVQTIATAKHAWWVQNGNTPEGGGNIYPKRAKALRFVINGTTIFAKWVRPAAPRPYMTEAATKAEPVFERLCKESIDTMFS